jgi:hypothetical protein
MYLNIIASENVKLTFVNGNNIRIVCTVLLIFFIMSFHVK